MFNFTINGKQVSYNDDFNLLQILRDKEGIYSAKDGCSEGACGTCTVLVDGKATRACIMKPSRLEGKFVLTLEGLTDREKDVYAYCFGKLGAVQCGFCIPGMVISGKALLDTNLNPTRKDVKAAIRGNICRCTGYKKIEDALLLAADFFRDDLAIPGDEFSGKIGESIERVDSRAKTLGTAKYVADMEFPNMAYGSAVRTKYPRAKVLSINTDKAKAHKDCVAIFTADDIDGNRYIGHLPHIQDWPALIAVGEETRYLGDSVALVVSETKESLKEIKSLVEVEYEELTPIINPLDALEPDAPKIHEKGNLLSQEHLIRGNVDEALEKSAHVFSDKFSTPPTEHAFLEPESAIGMPDEETGGILLYTGGQSIYDEQREVSSLLGLPREKVRVISAYVGGGFGGKEDMSVQHHAGFLGYKTKRPVMVTLSRQESIIVHPKRHGADMEFTVGCDKDGYLTAMKAVIITDTGAYASLGGPVLQRACTHAAGPYNYQNIDILGKTAYTNNPPGGAFRGFGVTQSAFAIECCVNKLAEMVGISPWEIRYRNAIRPGQVLPNGQIADEGTAMAETLDAVKDEFEKNKYVGIACSLKNAGIGVGLLDLGRCKLVYLNGKFHIRCAASCIGQGIGTVLLQIFCETTGIDKDMVVIDQLDTKYTPDSGTTTASRQTAISGEACRRASVLLKEALDKSSPEKLEGEIFYGEYDPKTDPMGSDKPNPVSHISYGYATQIVVLKETGELEKVVAAHDVGKAINPPALEGQIEGGVVMGLGYGLTEDYPLKDGVPLAKYGTLGLFRAPAVPPIESIIIEKNKSIESYGAKGVGEITTIPTAPACQGAYYALDGIFRTKLPLDNTFYRKPKVKK